jgi:hypothetical protein
MPPPPTHLRLTASAATQAIRARAEDSANVILTDHAQERMAERGIIALEVYRILRTGIVDVAPTRLTDGDWKAEIEQRMPGGRDAVVVTVVKRDERLVVVTVMWRDKR